MPSDYVKPPDDRPAEDMPKPREDLIRSAKATFEVQDLLGKGSFGAVFRVKRLQDEKELAMKCESVRAKKQILKFEAKVLLAASRINSPHIVPFEDRGLVRGRFVYIVMRLVGKNLWDLRMEMPEKKFTISTTMKIAEQSLAGIRDLHRAGYLHRDIKPPNLAIGRVEEETNHTVYVLDFGLCRRFRTDKVDLRIARAKAAFRGTTRYASLATLDLKEQSRRDDIEAWWYMNVEFMVGHLPWKHCKGTERALVRDYKRQLRDEPNMVKVLKNTPWKYWKAILLYTDRLDYNSIPDYDHIYRQLQAACQTYSISPTEPLCWDPTVPYKGPKYETGVDYNPKGEAEV